MIDYNLTMLEQNAKILLTDIDILRDILKEKEIVKINNKKNEMLLQVNLIAESFLNMICSLDEITKELSIDEKELYIKKIEYLQKKEGL